MDVNDLISKVHAKSMSIVQKYTHEPNSRYIRDKIKLDILDTINSENETLSKNLNIYLAPVLIPNGDNIDVEFLDSAEG